MKINDLAKKILKATAPNESSIAGFIGRISDNATIVPGKKNYVYVTLSSGIVVQARNRFTPPALGMAVLLRPINDRPTQFEIYDIRPAYGQDVDFVLLQNHAVNHDWTKPDETRAHLRQFLPLRVMPAAAGGIAVDINDGWYETTAGGTAKYLGNTSLSISSYTPATGALWLLIQLNRAGALVYSVSATKTVGTLLSTDIPHRTRGIIALAAIRLYPGQTIIRDAINRPDLIDLRFSLFPENLPVDQTPNRVLITLPSGEISTDGGLTYIAASDKLTLGEIDTDLTTNKSSLTQGGNDIDTIHEMETFDAGGSAYGRAPILRGRMGRGTSADPTSAQIGDKLLRIQGVSYDAPTSKTVWAQAFDHETAGPPYEYTAGTTPVLFPAWARLEHGGVQYQYTQPDDIATTLGSWGMNPSKFYFTATEGSATPIGNVYGIVTIRVSFTATGHVPTLAEPPCIDGSEVRDEIFTSHLTVERDALADIQAYTAKNDVITFYGCVGQQISTQSPIDGAVFVGGVWSGTVYQAATNAILFLSGHSASPALSGYINALWIIDIYPGLHDFTDDPGTAPAQINAVATQDHTATDHGTRWDILTTPDDSAVPELSAQIRNDGINIPAGNNYMINDVPLPTVTPDITTALTHAATSKTPPVDADEIPLLDSVASFSLKKLTWANLVSAVASPAWNITGNGDLTITVHYPERYVAATGGDPAYWKAAGTSVLDLSGTVPGAGYGRYVLIWYKVLDGSIDETNGGTVTPYTALAAVNIPAPENESGKTVIGYVRVYNGQTVITDAADIFVIDDANVESGGGPVLRKAYDASDKTDYIITNKDDTGIVAKTGAKKIADLLYLDQTTPQTITGGVPVFDDGLDAGASKIVNLADPVNPNDAVNLHYLVDHAGFIKEYFTHGSSVMSSTYVESETPDVETLDATPVDTLTLFYKSAVADTPTPFTIKAGSHIEYHFSAKVSTTTGVKVVTLQMRLFYVDADGTSNKTAVAGISDASAQLTTTKTYYELHSHIVADITVPSGKRLWVEIYANTSGVSVNYPDVSIYRDSINNHITFGVSGAILANFVPLTRTLTGTAPITIAGDNAAHDLSADRTIAIVAATAAVPGSMSAADKGKLDKIGDGITAGKVLTLTATDNFNLTVPATGTAAVHTSPTVAGYIPYFSGTTGILTSAAGLNFLSPAHLGVGITALSNVGVYTSRTITEDSGGIYGVYALVQSNPAGASSASIIGAAFSGRTLAGNAQAHSGGLYGVQVGASHQGTGLLAQARAMQSQVLNTSTGTITDAYSLIVLGATNSGGGTITNNYGLYLSAMTVGGTLNYALYSNAGLVHFGDSVDLASAKTLTLLDANIVASGTTGVSFGSATTQKISFYGKTPIIQRASANQAAAPAGGTGATAGAYDTAAHRDTMITLVNEMRLALIAFGLIKGSA